MPWRLLAVWAENMAVLIHIYSLNVYWPFHHTPSAVTINPSLGKCLVRLLRIRGKSCRPPNKVFSIFQLYEMAANVLCVPFFQSYAHKNINVCLEPSAKCACWDTSANHPMRLAAIFFFVCRAAFVLSHLRTGNIEVLRATEFLWPNPDVTRRPLLLTNIVGFRPRNEHQRLPGRGVCVELSSFCFMQ